MNSNQTERDLLKSMFSHVPEEEMPPNFQSDMMQKIRKESIRITKRNKALQLLGLISCSIVTIGLAVAALIYLEIPFGMSEIPSIAIKITPVDFPPYYLHFGFLVLILLVGDHLFRRYYYNKTVRS